MLARIAGSISLLSATKPGVSASAAATSGSSSGVTSIAPVCPPPCRGVAPYDARIADIAPFAAGTFAELLATPWAADVLGALNGMPVAVVDTADGVAVPTLGSLPVVAVAISHTADPLADPLCAEADIAVAADEEVALADLVERIAATPIASTAMAVLLRASTRLGVDEALGAESAVYSALQAGAEFVAWRESRPRRDQPEDPSPAVRVEWRGSDLHLTLDRPARRNAYSVAMREALIGGLQLADASTDRVVVRGAGPSFCSGGDLDEFGSRPDPGTAHLIRLSRSAARLVHGLRDRVEVELHGWCVGAGIELPAFAATVRAAPDTRISLPELAFGLVPGAGGTVSLPRRIGRQRTNWLAMSGATLDATTALAWGLVDELDEGSE